MKVPDDRQARAHVYFCAIGQRHDFKCQSNSFTVRPLRKQECTILNIIMDIHAALSNHCHGGQHYMGIHRLYCIIPKMK